MKKINLKTEAGKPKVSELNIGILALQGAYDLHVGILERVGFQLQDIAIRVSFVKSPSQLDEIDGIILPGGESTVVTKLLSTSGLDKPLRDELENGMPAFGACAGLIILNNHYQLLDCEVVRNAYGTQIDSFDAEVDFLPTKSKCKAFFIRAPRIRSVGPDTSVIAVQGEETVGVSKGNIMGITCHPEVAGSANFHEFFVENIISRVSSLKV